MKITNTQSGGDCPACDLGQGCLSDSDCASTSLCTSAVCTTAAPSSAPSYAPSTAPSTNPSPAPSPIPSDSPTSDPSVTPTAAPSTEPSHVPSSGPSSFPSQPPTSDPSAAPTVATSLVPSAAPTSTPSSQSSTTGPSLAPSPPPTLAPSLVPSTAPSAQPSSTPSSAPTAAPTAHHCKNGEHDAGEHETDVDCGGGDCPVCALGQDCIADTDCTAGTVCLNSTCATAAPSSIPSAVPSASPSSAPPSSRSPSSRPSASPSSSPTVPTTTGGTSAAAIDSIGEAVDGGSLPEIFDAVNSSVQQLIVSAGGDGDGASPELVAELQDVVIEVLSGTLIENATTFDDVEAPALLLALATSADAPLRPNTATAAVELVATIAGTCTVVAAALNEPVPTSVATDLISTTGAVMVSLSDGQQNFGESSTLAGQIVDQMAVAVLSDASDPVTIATAHIQFTSWRVNVTAELEEPAVAAMTSIGPPPPPSAAAGGDDGGDDDASANVNFRFSLPLLDDLSGTGAVDVIAAAMPAQLYSEDEPSGITSSIARLTFFDSVSAEAIQVSDLSVPIEIQIPVSIPDSLFANSTGATHVCGSGMDGGQGRTSYTWTLECGDGTAKSAVCTADDVEEGAVLNLTCLPLLSSRTCQFWHSDSATWRNDGCVLTDGGAAPLTHSSAVTCSCNHTTDFAANTSDVLAQLGTNAALILTSVIRFDPADVPQTILFIVVGSWVALGLTWRWGNIRDKRRTRKTTLGDELKMAVRNIGAARVLELQTQKAGGKKAAPALGELHRMSSVGSRISAAFFDLGNTAAGLNQREEKNKNRRRRSTRRKTSRLREIQARHRREYHFGTHFRNNLHRMHGVLAIFAASKTSDNMKTTHRILILWCKIHGYMFAGAFLFWRSDGSSVKDELVNFEGGVMQPITLLVLLLYSAVSSLLSSGLARIIKAVFVTVAAEKRTLRMHERKILTQQENLAGRLRRVQSPDATETMARLLIFDLHALEQYLRYRRARMLRARRVGDKESSRRLHTGGTGGDITLKIPDLSVRFTLADELPPTPMPDDNKEHRTTAGMSPAQLHASIGFASSRDLRGPRASMIGTLPQEPQAGANSPAGLRLASIGAATGEEERHHHGERPTTNPDQNSSGSPDILALHAMIAQHTISLHGTPSSNTGFNSVGGGRSHQLVRDSINDAIAKCPHKLQVVLAAQDDIKRRATSIAVRTRRATSAVAAMDAHQQGENNAAEIESGDGEDDLTNSQLRTDSKKRATAMIATARATQRREMHSKKNDQDRLELAPPPVGDGGEGGHSPPPHTHPVKKRTTVVAPAPKSPVLPVATAPRPAQPAPKPGDEDSIDDYIEWIRTQFKLLRTREAELVQYRRKREADGINEALSSATWRKGPLLRLGIWWRLRVNRRTRMKDLRLQSMSQQARDRYRSDQLILVKLNGLSRLIFRYMVMQRVEQLPKLSADRRRFHSYILAISWLCFSSLYVLLFSAWVVSPEDDPDHNHDSDMHPEELPKVWAEAVVLTFLVSNVVFAPCVVLAMTVAQLCLMKIMHVRLAEAGDGDVDTGDIDMDMESVDI